MISVLLASLALAPVQATPVVQPCIAKKVSAEESKVLIRKLRRQGFRVRVTKPGQPTKVVAEGGDFLPVALRHANVEVSGCGR